MGIKTDFLIIGAGPFGLSMAAYAWHLGIDYRIIGIPMEFWKNNMPAGMHLRSGVDWHLDPCGECTLIRFMKEKNIDPDLLEPIPVQLYMEYADWFIKQKEIIPLNQYVTKLDYHAEDEYRFKAFVDGQQYIETRYVLIAIGFGYFKYMPGELITSFPDVTYSHTANLIEFSKLTSKDCIIVGGRQSAYEWALLMKQAGVNNIHLVHRHSTPEFTESDWSWVQPMLDEMIINPESYLNLSSEDKEHINNRFWQEGRLRLEPWLGEVRKYDDVEVYENNEIRSVNMTQLGKVQALLADDKEITADHLLFATGYKVDLSRVPFLNQGNILNILVTENGFPKLGPNFQSNIAGLFFTSLLATADYGTFFGFTVSCNASALIIGSAVNKLLSKS